MGGLTKAATDQQSDVPATVAAADKRLAYFDTIPLSRVAKDCKTELEACKDDDEDILGCIDKETSDDTCDKTLDEVEVEMATKNPANNPKKGNDPDAGNKGKLNEDTKKSAGGRIVASPLAVMLPILTVPFMLL